MWKKELLVYPCQKIQTDYCFTEVSWNLLLQIGKQCRARSECTNELANMELNLSQMPYSLRFPRALLIYSLIYFPDGTIWVICFENIEDICRRQLWKPQGKTKEISLNIKIMIEASWKCLGKMRNCLWAISPFATMFSKTSADATRNVCLHVGKGFK